MWSNWIYCNYVKIWFSKQVIVHEYERWKLRIVNRDDSFFLLTFTLSIINATKVVALVRWPQLQTRACVLYCLRECLNCYLLWWFPLQNICHYKIWITGVCFINRTVNVSTRVRMWAAGILRKGNRPMSSKAAVTATTSDSIELRLINEYDGSRAQSVTDWLEKIE